MGFESETRITRTKYLGGMEDSSGLVLGVSGRLLVCKAMDPQVP